MSQHRRAFGATSGRGRCPSRRAFPGVPYRELGLKGKRIGKAKAVSLIMEDVNLLKRPLLVKGKRMIFGLDEAAYREL